MYVLASFSLDALKVDQFSLQFVGKSIISFEELPENLVSFSLENLDGNVLSLPVKIGEIPTKALFDTGAGLTSVNKNFVDANPNSFEFVQDITNGQDANGFPVTMKLYKVKKIVIGNKVYENEYALAIDFDIVHQHVQKEMDFILGFNIITKANWFFNLKKANWMIE